jgi:Bifunctional DNA primase/polymerase, N-terminal
MKRLEDALFWTGKGFPILPIAKGKQKKPTTEHGLYDASLDFEKARQWFRDDRYNIGLRIMEGFLVIDPDGPEGIAQLDELQSTHGALPKTLTQKTGRGFHYFFCTAAPVRKCNIAPNINLIAAGKGYVIGARSVHHSGAIYTIIDNSPIAEAPDWVVELASPPKPAPMQSHRPAARQSDFQPRYVLAAVERELDAVASAGESGRNIAVHRAAVNLGTLVAAGAIYQSDAETALFSAASATGLPPTEIRKTIASGFKFGVQHPRAVPPRKQSARPSLSREALTIMEGASGHDRMF